MGHEIYQSEIFVNFKNHETPFSVLCKLFMVHENQNTAGVKDFSLILVIISNFFFQAEWPGGNYVGQYCSLLALISTHTSNVY